MKENLDFFDCFYVTKTLIDFVWNVKEFFQNQILILFENLVALFQIRTCYFINSFLIPYK